MAESKPAVTPVLMHWSYCSLALSHQYVLFCVPTLTHKTIHSDGLVQACSNSSANALELLQSCTKPSLYIILFADIDPHQTLSPLCCFHTVLSLSDGNPGPSRRLWNPAIWWGPLSLCDQLSAAICWLLSIVWVRNTCYCLIPCNILRLQQKWQIFCRLHFQMQFGFKLQCSLSLRVQLTIRNCWLR